MLSEYTIGILIIIHATFGGIALISGPLALIAMKGAKWHRRFGILFFYAMLTSALLALIISVSPKHENLFLFCVGIFSAYLTCSGYRTLYLKSLSRNGKAQFVDWLLSIVMLLFGIVMLVYGIMDLSKGGAMGIVLVVFATLALVLSIIDVKLYIKKTKEKSFWLFAHIGKMNGAVIAAFTAFIVVNEVIPGVIGWLLPGVLGAIVGIYFSRKYKRAIIKKGKKPEEVVRVEIN